MVLTDGRESANKNLSNNTIMNKDYRYHLETPRITGRRQQKFTCPQCEKPKCFVRYVDTKNGCRYVADNVGKCDHEHSCGYHYKPSDYYRDNPEDRNSGKNTDFTPPPLPPFSPLPMDYVTRSHSVQSTFWQWVTNDVAHRLDISQQRLQQVFDDYLLGATHQSDVIFWQIDERGQVHGGHIMQYRADGHRGGYQGWTHIKLIREGLLPLDWQLYQCLFGQHLLAKRPNDQVCLVEGEKTALIMALCEPEHLWLATAGSGGLAAEKMACLRGRRVTLFPDSGCYDKWSSRMQQTEGIDYHISRQLESYPPNTDLCDLLL
jgi:hypothetical protein